MQRILPSKVFTSEITSPLHSAKYDIKNLLKRVFQFQAIENNAQFL